MPQLYGDPVLIFRIFDNLITNALKYSPAGTTVRIRLLHDPAKDSIVAEVADQGSGVPLEQQDLIFEKYGTLQNAPESMQQFGLGLYFCKLAAEAHKGNIRVRPNEPFGSVFCLELPRVTADGRSKRNRENSCKKIPPMYCRRVEAIRGESNHMHWEGSMLFHFIFKIRRSIMSAENQSPKPPESGKPAAATPPAETKPAAPAAKKHSAKMMAGIVAAAVVLIFVIRAIINSMGIVSTDDAYVNSHVTFVAPRVAGQVKAVLVDDNNRVHRGDVMVQLDDEPYQVQVNLKQAAVDVAEADLVAANASVRGAIGQVRSARFKLEHTIDQVHNDIELVSANVAALNSAKASLTLAQQEFDRAKKLLASNVASNEEFDKRQEELARAEAQYNQALQTVYQSRAALGLPIKPENSDDLTQVPPDLDQTAPAVRQAQADLIQGAAQLNVVISSYKLTPRQMIDEFYKRDPQGDIDRIYEGLVKEAPAIKQAEAKLESARRDLDEANLNLRYCTSSPKSTAWSRAGT